MEQRGLHETVQRRVEWFIRSEIPDCSFSNLIWEVAIISLIIIQLYSIIIQSFNYHIQLLFKYYSVIIQLYSNES